MSKTLKSKLMLKNILNINFNHITKLFFALCLLFTFTSCDSSNDSLESSLKVRTIDFTEADLMKLHNGAEKSWRLTKVIIPEEQKDYPSVINNACVADDIYTFSALTTNENIENVKINLGDSRCFETISEAESFEAKLLYVPYNFNGDDVIETTLILKYSRINNIEDNETSTTSNIDAFRLVELTDDRMVFSNATYVGEYTYGYVFERINE